MTQTTRSLPKDPSSVTNLRLVKILPWLIYAYLLLEVIVLTLAFFLLLFNASTDGRLHPVGLPQRRPGPRAVPGHLPVGDADNGSVIDFAVLFAIIIYGILAMLALSVIHWIDRKIMEERAKARWLAEGRHRPRPHRRSPRQVTARPDPARQLVAMRPRSPAAHCPSRPASTSG